MFANATPAIEALVRAVELPFIWGQVLVEAAGSSYSLKHVSDEKNAAGDLRNLKTEELRALVSKNAQGEFRPLRSAPDMPGGWRCQAQGTGGLESALNELYPGSVADWFAARNSPSSVTHYREFTARQSGMYRITQMLPDEAAQAVARATCHARFCLKRRLWSVGTLEADPAETKSMIPCLEPCAILLETARKAMRIEQEEKIPIALAPSELESLLGAAEEYLRGGGGTVKAAEFGSALNPRRLQLVLEKYKAVLPRKKGAAED